MKTARPLVAAVAAACLTFGPGCLTLTPVGPLAKTLFPPPAAGNPEPGVTVATAADASSRPMLAPAPPPPPPTLLVTPGEASAANHQDVARRLVQEMEIDRKAIDSMPSYAEVSVVGESR